MSPAAGVPAAQSGEIVNATAATTSVPSEVKGDWVLFHPVYSQEELRSVEVSLEIFDSFLGCAVEQSALSQIRWSAGTYLD